MRFSGTSPLHDADGETLGDGRLAHARLADQDRIVLRPAREDLQDAADLLVPPDDGIDLAFAGEFVEVAGVALERFVAALGVLISRALAAPDVLQNVQDGFFRHALIPHRLPDVPLRLGQPDEQVLAGDVLVAEQLGLSQSAVENFLQRLADILPRDARAGDDGQLRHRLVGLGAEVVGVGPQTSEDGHHNAVRIAEERLEQMRRLDALVVCRGGDLGRLLHRLLRFYGKLL